MIDGTGAPVFTHLLALADDRGVFEHAERDVPRPEHGYCVDDVARALVVLMREPELTEDLQRLADICLHFVDRAVRRDGRTHNRMAVSGVFTDRPATGDWWGRAVWALGVTVTGGRTDAARSTARNAFVRAASARSGDLRAMAFAAIGAADVLSVDPTNPWARALASDAAISFPANGESAWPWPEPRLRYGNAVLPEALLALGSALDDARLIDRGLLLLRFLMDVETRDGHLSVTGVRGRRPSQRAAQFDQQPIEIAAIADACARAFDITGDRLWRDGVDLAWAWFAGDNDSSVVMVDATGAGFDGLTATGRNENRGAESTLAALSTYQQALRARVLHTVSA